MKSLELESWLATAHLDRRPTATKSLTGTLHVFGQEGKAFSQLLAKEAPAWLRAGLKNTQKTLVHFSAARGPMWVLRPRPRPAAVSHGGRLEDSPSSEFRDAGGALLGLAKAAGIERLIVEFHDCSVEQRVGLLTGLEIASYSFRESRTPRKTPMMELWLRAASGGLDPSDVTAARERGAAVNLARHLVNLPPNELHPESFAQMIKSRATGTGLKVEVWDTARLKKEKMGLHLAVGQGAEHGPCLVRLSWRPTKKAGVKASPRGPVALVGKGITFDTGGVDIKPSSGMRLMKKDMGGAAAVAAVAMWAAATNYGAPLDIYLALAENAVDGKSFRPSDLIVARNGQTVEIDNTDAEGRLVLADALDVAVTRTGGDAPEVVVNVATLTGAIKVALGAEIAGLFSNDDVLGEELNLAGQRAGDLNWRMPLADRYWGSLSSPFADFKNSADGFGGAITAALFLSRFVRGKSWAHLDIYAWNDKAMGPYSTAGGSGQGVQCLIQWLESRL